MMFWQLKENSQYIPQRKHLKTYSSETKGIKKYLYAKHLFSMKQLQQEKLSNSMSGVGNFIFFYPKMMITMTMQNHHDPNTYL